MPANSAKRSPLLLIFLTVLIDMIGFGIVIPVLPLYADGSRFGATPLQTGLILGIYSLMQLIFAPVFGSLSDRFGRKPILVFSILGTALGFLVLGLAGSIWMLLLGRVIDGASGGNISTAMACIADVTTKENRSRNMGLIGAAFGLGFMIGPALGGVLSEKISVSAPFFFAAALAVINAFLVWLNLPETLTAESRSRARERATLAEIFSGGRTGLIGALLGSQLFSIIGFSIMTALLALFCQARFGYTQAQVGYLLFYVGFLGIVFQGGLLRRLLRRPIEKPLALIGSAVLAASMALFPFVYSLPMLLLVCTGISLGNSFVTPTLNGMASRSIDAHAQGRVLGLMQSAGSLGRFLGPMIGMFFVRWDDASHYGRTSFYVSAGVLVLAFFCVALVSPGQTEIGAEAIPDV